MASAEISSSSNVTSNNTKPCGHQPIAKSLELKDDELKTTIILDDDTEELYFVEAIVDDRISKGQTFYKVRWKGYSPSEDSWEPEDNLSSVLELIDEYHTKKGTSKSQQQPNRSVITVKTTSNPNSVESISNDGYTSKKHIPRSRKKFKFEYVPKHELVAHKTKFFDDVSSGKIDLTSNDLYSRVKTRRRTLENHSSSSRNGDGSIEGDSENEPSSGIELLAYNSAPSSPKSNFTVEEDLACSNGASSATGLAERHKSVSEDSYCNISSDCSSISRKRKMGMARPGSQLDSGLEQHENGTTTHSSASSSATKQNKNAVQKREQSTTAKHCLDGEEEPPNWSSHEAFMESTANGSCVLITDLTTDDEIKYQSTSSSIASNAKSDITDAACFDDMPSSSNSKHMLLQPQPQQQSHPSFPDHELVGSLVISTTGLSSGVANVPSSHSHNFQTATGGLFSVQRISAASICSVPSTPNTRFAYNYKDFFSDYLTALHNSRDISAVPRCNFILNDFFNNSIDVQTLDQFLFALQNGRWDLIDQLSDERLLQIFSPGGGSTATGSSGGLDQTRHPLHVALWEAEGRPQFLDRLYRLNRGFQLDLESIDANSGLSFVYLSVCLGRLSSLKWFLEHGAKPNAMEQVSGRDRTLLGEAISQGNLKAISILLLHGANLYQVEKGLTALGLIQKLMETHALNRNYSNPSSSLATPTTHAGNTNGTHAGAVDAGHHPPHHKSNSVCLIPPPPIFQLPGFHSNEHTPPVRRDSFACLLNARYSNNLEYTPPASSNSTHSQENGCGSMSQQLFLNAKVHQNKTCHGNIPLVHGPEVHCACLPSVDLLKKSYELVSLYHTRLSEDIHAVISDWLDRCSLRRVAVLHPCLWISVKDVSSCLDLPWGWQHIDHNLPPEDTQGSMPILLLIHSRILGPGIFDMWIDRSGGPCVVQRVLVDGMAQRGIGSEHLFVSTVLPRPPVDSMIANETEHRVMVAFKQVPNEINYSIAMILLLVKPLATVPPCLPSSSFGEPP